MKPKTLGNSDANGTSVNVPDVVFVGNGDTFQLICKASSQSEGWMKSTKAMQIEGVGCLVQVTTQQRNPDESYVCAEAITFVPGVKIAQSSSGLKLVAINAGVPRSSKPSTKKEKGPPPDKQQPAEDETEEDTGADEKPADEKAQESEADQA